jgi:uncharacterized membrane protein YeaQ/YmgE (transglycosylase-associated protein family)
MSILAWVVLGVIAGFAASKLMNKTSEGVALDIALGVVGALLGGWLFNQFGAGVVTGLNWWSFPPAVIVAVVVLVGYHTIVGRGARLI